MEVVTSGGRAQLRAAGRTHTGRRRKRNEDFVFLRPKLGLFLVADGVGGRNAGKVASELAAFSMNDFFQATRTWPWPEEYLTRLDPAASPALQRLAAAIRKANRDLRAVASTHPEHGDMTSTMVAVHLDYATGVLHLGHVGDSRCYRVRPGLMERLTSDHTLRNAALTEKPDLAKAELARIPPGVLTRALGARDTLQVDLLSLELLPGDTFLLCSDGLHRMVDEPRILEAIQLRPDPDDVCELLLTLANGAGGRDNITALVLRLDPA